MISTAPAVSFRLTPADTDLLLRAGVSEETIKMMSARENGSSSPTGQAPVAAVNSPNARPTGAEKANDTVTVTSIPIGATVEWNRKVIGVTPLTYQVGEYAFNVRKLTIWSKHLLQPVVLRVSMPGYTAKESVITTGWTKGAGTKSAWSFYTIVGNDFNFELDKTAAVRTALTNADVVKLKTAGFGDELILDKINTNPAAFHLEFDDMVELRKVGISDAIIQAMLHAK